MRGQRIRPSLPEQRGRTRRAGLLLTAAAALGVAALAGLGAGISATRQAPSAAAPAAAPDLLGLAARLPASVDVLISVRSAAEVRASPGGALIERSLRESGLLTDLRPAWDSVARRLEMDRAAAFDALMGQEVIVVGRGVPPAPGASGEPGRTVRREWSLLSRVPAAVEQRVRAAMFTAPLTIEQGVQIFSLEDGRYTAASVPDPQVAGQAILILGPTDDRGLFRDALAALRQQHAGPLLKSTTIATASIYGGGPRVLVAASLDDQPPALDAAGDAQKAVGPTPWDRFVLLAGAPLADRPLGWRTRLIVRRGPDDAGELPEPTSDALFTRLRPGTLLCMVESPGLGRLVKQLGAPTIDALAILQIPEDARGLLSGRSVAWMREVGPERLTGGLAMATSDTAALAPAMDAAMARFVQRLERQLGGAGSDPVDFGGRLPEVVRVLPIRRGEDAPAAVTSDPAPAPSRPAAAEPASFIAAWTYVVNRAAGIPAGAGPRSGPGWWAVQIGRVGGAGGGMAGGDQNPAAGAARDNAANGAVGGGEQDLSNALLDHAEMLASDGADAPPNAAPPAPITARWLVLASARPAELEKHLPSIVPDVRGVRSAMRRIDELTVRVRADAPGEIIGDIEWTLTPTPPATPLTPLTPPTPQTSSAAEPRSAPGETAPSAVPAPGGTPR